MDNNDHTHPAWQNFTKEFAPALNEFDCTLSLTTEQILDQLNGFAADNWFSTAELVQLLQANNFKNKTLPESSTTVWLLKPVVRLSFK